MKNLILLNGMVIVGMILSNPLLAEQEPIHPHDRYLFLETVADSVGLITSNEILSSSEEFRYGGGVNRFNFLYDTVNDVAEREGLNNMERLEFLKYLLDAGFVPLPPYINLPDYFVQDNRSNNESFPTVKNLDQLREACLRRIWFCDTSPISLMRLALSSTSLLRESGQTVLSYTNLEELFDQFGYTSEDFTPHDLKVLGQFLRDLHYIPLWPDLSVQRPHIKDVTDHNFQAEVIDASRDKPVIVYFYASWCPPCRTMTPVIEELAEDLEGAFTLANIYFDGNPNSREIQSKASIPNLIFYRDGEKVSEIYGIPNVDTKSFSTPVFAEQIGPNIFIHKIDREEVIKATLRNEIRTHLELIEQQD